MESKKDNSQEDTQKTNEERTDPHWLLHELNEILEKGMFKNG